MPSSWQYSYRSILALFHSHNCREAKAFWQMILDLSTIFVGPQATQLIYLSTQQISIVAVKLVGLVILSRRIALLLLLKPKEDAHIDSIYTKTFDIITTIGAV